MKSICLIILLLSVLGQAASQSISRDINESFGKLIWLEGRWVNTNSKQGQLSFEQWKKKAPGELYGYGVAMKGVDTLFSEKLRILIQGNAIYYVADVPENLEPVYFRLTEITDMSFTCENLEHDFPKKIAYRLLGKKLKATISGNGKSIEYLFVKE